MVTKQKRLGRTDLYVSPVGLGCMGLSHAYGDAVPEEEGITFLKEAIKTGYNFFDTAEVYVGKTTDGMTSNNEEMLGAAIETYRDDVVIASKFGITLEGTSLVTDSSPENIRKSIEGTLHRLDVDCLAFITSTELIRR